MFKRVATILTLAATCALTATTMAGTSIRTVRVASGISRPLFMTAPAGDYDRLFIVEKLGRIRILNLQTGVLNGASFLDINTIVGGTNSFNDEQGMLGLAFHPDYDNNGYFYVYYTNNSGNTVVARYEVSANPDLADSGSAFTIMTFSQPQGNHNGGWIGFGPDDGYLYIATGDGGNGNDQGSGHSAGGNAQDITSNLLGKMLRIDVDGGSPYAVPSDNPYVGITGDDEIFYHGLRNPWRNSFDRQTGDFYIGDVGQGAWEEIDYIQATEGVGGVPGGLNFGWRCMEGDSCTGLSGCTCNSGVLTDPIYDYVHGGGSTSGFCVTGGYVYRGCAIPDLDGVYFFGDFSLTRAWSARVVAGAWTEFTIRTSQITPSIDGFTVSGIASFGEDAAGEIYIADHGGEVFRIIAAGGPTEDCNENDVQDACDILLGDSKDGNGNGIPDECEETCLSDFNGDETVDAADLAVVLGAWGPCRGCPADLNGDDVVDANDLAILLGSWGPC